MERRVWLFSSGQIDPGQIDNQAEKAARLMWKLFYFAYEADSELKARMETMAHGERVSFHDRARDAAWDYCLSRVLDRKETQRVDSPFKDHVANIMIAAGRPGEIFVDGSENSSLSIGVCLLRFDGWHPKSDASEAEFADFVFHLDYNGQNRGDVMDRIVDAISEHYHFTGDLDEDVFVDVDDFRERNQTFMAFLT